MSLSRKSNKPCRSHATRRHGATPPAAAQLPLLAEWSRLGAELNAIAWLARVALREERAA
jgi:hypothetical protein